MTATEFIYYLKGKLEGRNRIEALEIKALLEKADEVIISGNLDKIMPKGKGITDRGLPPYMVDRPNPFDPKHPWNQPYCSSTNQVYTDLEKGEDLDIDTRI